MATPVNLEIAFHPPATSVTFHGGIKLFAEAVTRSCAGAAAIALYPDAALGGLLTTQIELIDRSQTTSRFTMTSLE
jgi:hypothetical protein